MLVATSGGYVHAYMIPGTGRFTPSSGRLLLAHFVVLATSGGMGSENKVAFGSDEG